MHSFIRQPFLFFLFFFAFGILLGFAQTKIYFVVLLAISFLLLTKYFIGRSYLIPFSFVFIFIFGTVLGALNSAKGPNHISRFEGQTLHITSDYSGTIRNRNGHSELTASVLQPYTGKLLLRWEKDAEESPTVSTRIYCEGQVKPIHTTSESYRNYLRAKGLHQILDCNCVEFKRGNWLREAGHVIRKSLMEMFRRIIKDEQNAALITAMLTGDKGGIDKKVRSQFAAAGVAHVLAISGLHVSIIYISLLSIFSLVLPGKKYRVIRSMTTLLFLVAFALLVGAGPAVRRATFMLACLLCSNLMERHSDSINTLAFSAFLLIVWDPLLIIDAGFQLSYSAVAGIMVLSPPISKHLQKAWPKVHLKIIELISVSMAAQFATLPLVCYHFGAFPSYFLLANLTVLPITAVAVRLGFFAFLVGFIPFIGQAWGYGLNFLLGGIRSIAQLIEGIPGSVVSLENGLSGLRGLIIMTLIVVSIIILPNMIRDLIDRQFRFQFEKKWSGALNPLVNLGYHAFSIFQLS